MFLELFLSNLIAGNVATHTIDNFHELDTGSRIVVSRITTNKNISGNINNLDPNNKINTILHITKNPDKSTLNSLIGFLSDKDYRVRGNAAIALGKTDSLEVVPYLINSLKDQNHAVRAAAALSLGRLRAINSVNNLIECLNDSNESVKLSVIYSLGAIESKKAIIPLIKILNDNSPIVRENASWVLGLLKSVEALPYLKLLTEDPDANVRATAKRSLFYIKYSMVSDISNVNYSGGSGTNFDDAIKINGIRNSFACLRSQKEYIKRFYGNQTTWEEVDQSHIEYNKKHYQLITVKENPSGNFRKFYFDITEFFNKF